MKKILCHAFLAAMLVGAVSGAEPVAAPQSQPESKPKPKSVRPVRTYKDVLAVLPKDLEPENARDWSEAQKEVANGILKKNLVDRQRPMTMRFKVHGVDHWGRFTVWSHLPADEGYAIRVFAGDWNQPNMLPKLATLRKGDLIEMSGVCDLAKFENLWNTKSLTLGIGKASIIKLEPNGKPAHPPALVPVKLVSAVYGSGTKFTEVTQRVQALLDEPGAIFYANPHWLGADPTPGWNKALVIVHEVDGQRRTFTSGENGAVSVQRLMEPAPSPAPKA